MEVFNVSKATMYKEMKHGKFGTPIQVGRAYKIPRMYIWNKFFDCQQKNININININKENIDDSQKIQNNFISIANECLVEPLEDDTNLIDKSPDEIIKITQISSQIEWSEKTASKDNFYLELGYV